MSLRPALSRRVYRIGDDSGAGSVLAVALIAAVLIVTTILLPGLLLLSTAQAAAGAADAAALAGADAASGLVSGSPCEVAGEVASANHATVTECIVDAGVVTVQLELPTRLVAVPGRATAGPPPDGGG